MNRINKTIAAQHFESLVRSCKGSDLKMIVNGEMLFLDRKAVKTFLARIKTLADVDKKVFSIISKWVGIYSLED